MSRRYRTPLVQQQRGAKSRSTDPEAADGRSLLFSLYFSTNQPCLKVASILARLRWQACFTAALSVRGGDSPEEPGCRRVLRGACPCFALVSGVVSSTIRANTNTGSHSVDIAIFVRCSRKVRSQPRRSFEYASSARRKKKSSKIRCDELGDRARGKLCTEQRNQLLSWYAAR